MAINGNLASGQQQSLALPKILVGGVQIATGVQQQDERLNYYRGVRQVSAPASLTFTTTDSGVDLHYTFNGRTPTSKSPKYTGAIALHQNKTGDNTVVKVRAFGHTNTNKVSEVIKATLNVIGGNTTGYTSH